MQHPRWHRYVAADYCELQPWCIADISMFNIHIWMHTHYSSSSMTHAHYLLHQLMQTTFSKTNAKIPPNIHKVDEQLCIGSSELVSKLYTHLGSIYWHSFVWIDSNENITNICLQTINTSNWFLINNNIVIRMNKFVICLYVDIIMFVGWCQHLTEWHVINNAITSLYTVYTMSQKNTQADFCPHLR